MAVKMTTLCKKLFGSWRKQKPYIRFYSLEPGVLDLFPIVKSSSIKRNFEDTPDYENIPSVANCPGINKIVSSGWIAVAPADFIIKTYGDGVKLEWLEPWRFKNGNPGHESYVSLHGRAQAEPVLDDPADTVKTVVKLETPWRVETSDDVVLLQMPVAYNNESRFYAATGILDTRYGHTLNIQLFWKVMQGETLVRAGTPLCQYVPVLRSALSTSNYDVVIDNATEEDRQKEQEFNYAANCVFLGKDTLASRLTRSLKILNKYKKRG